MLTAGHFAILDRLYSCVDHKCRRKIFTESFSKEDFLNFHYLVNQRLIYDSMDDVSLAPKGLAALDEYRLSLEQEARQKAERERNEHLRDQRDRKKEARRSWVQWTITTILSILSFFAGAIVEESTGLMQWITNLFH